MRLRPLAFPLLLLVPLACAATTAPSVPPALPAPAPPSSPSAATAASFPAFTGRFLRAYLEHFPTEATALGEHAYDARWPDLSAAGDAATFAFVAASRAELRSFAPASLSEDERVDASVLGNALDRMEFELREQKPAELVPRTYANVIGDGLDPLVTREFAPLEVRMKSLEGRLQGIPGVVAVAKERLGRPPQVNTETSIEQLKGLVGLCEHDLPELFAKIPAQQAALEAARQPALAALKDLLAFLRDVVLPRSDGDFRAGRDRFTKTLRFQVDDPALDPDALERDARATMRETQGAMLATALELWPTLMKGPRPQPATDGERKAAIRAVLDKLAEDRLDDATIVPEAQRLLTDATEFVHAHDLMTLPVEPCSVIVMPEYKRGFAVAYCEASGPFEAHPLTFVALSPPPADWPAERRLSQYREYNRSMLADLLVHEGMPGHYLQLMHKNHFKSDVRAVFDDGAFVEGWAVYGEWLMAKYGFGGPKVHMEQLKMLLRVATNTVLDHEIHAGTMDEKQALSLMEGEAFQEEGEAVKKWRRARISQGQLSTYFYGFRELMKLRREAEARPGFAEHAYNDRVLAFGSPPIRALRGEMGLPWLAAPIVDRSIAPPVDGGPEAGQVLLRGAATGTQNYRCECPHGGADAGACAWVFVAPAANLVDRDGTVFAVHSAPTSATHPVWTSTDGSAVVGRKVAAFDAGAGSIPWLLLQAASYGDGSGVMSRVKYVQRVNTRGGVAPATGCDDAHKGTTSDVGYTADYYFWGN